jgi:NifU-like protein involved in Fe-S cluster formation
MSANQNVYTQRLLDYWDRSLFGFTRDGYSHGASESSPLCGDEVEFRVVLRDSRLEAVDAWAQGCCVLECCAAMLAELARGKPLTWLDAFTNQDWTNHVNIPISESRKKSCLMLPLRCLRKAVATPYERRSV